jgi:hypothetical protein
MLTHQTTQFVRDVLPTEATPFEVDEESRDWLDVDVLGCIANDLTHPVRKCVVDAKLPIDIYGYTLDGV